MFNLISLKHPSREILPLSEPLKPPALSRNPPFCREPGSLAQSTVTMHDGSAGCKLIVCGDCGMNHGRITRQEETYLPFITGVGRMA